MDSESPRFCKILLYLFFIFLFIEIAFKMCEVVSDFQNDSFVPCWVQDAYSRCLIETETDDDPEFDVYGYAIAYYDRLKIMCSKAVSLVRQNLDQLTTLFRSILIASSGCRRVINRNEPFEKVDLLPSKVLWQIKTVFENSNGGIFMDELHGSIQNRLEWRLNVKELGYSSWEEFVTGGLFHQTTRDNRIFLTLAYVPTRNDTWPEEALIMGMKVEPFANLTVKLSSAAPRLQPLSMQLD